MIDMGKMICLIVTGVLKHKYVWYFNHKKKFFFFHVNASMVFEWYE